jgi:hypothetical protein
MNQDEDFWQKILGKNRRRPKAELNRESEWIATIERVATGMTRENSEAVTDGIKAV